MYVLLEVSLYCLTMEYACPSLEPASAFTGSGLKLIIAALRPSVILTGKLCAPEHTVGRLVSLPVIQRRGAHTGIVVHRMHRTRFKKLLGQTPTLLRAAVAPSKDHVEACVHVLGVIVWGA